MIVIYTTDLAILCMRRMSSVVRCASRCVAPRSETIWSLLTSTHCSCDYSCHNCDYLWFTVNGL